MFDFDFLCWFVIDDYLLKFVCESGVVFELFVGVDLCVKFVLVRMFDDVCVCWNLMFCDDVFVCVCV